MAAAEAPPSVYRWVAYRARRRTDWRVVVRPASADSDRDAVLDERFPDKARAAARAGDLLRDIRAGVWQPPASAGR